MIPLVTCLFLFCQVAAETGRCVERGELAIVETREVVTDTPRPFLSAEKAACQRRFRELVEISPAADERPVRYEVGRVDRSFEPRPAMPWPLALAEIEEGED